MTAKTAQSWYFNKRPQTYIENDTLVLREAPLPPLAPGEFLFKTKYLSLDATNRVWLSDWDIYMEPVHLGDPMRGFVAGEIVESRNDSFPVGSYATGLATWSDYIIGDAKTFTPFAVPKNIDFAQAFAILSIAGPTAHVGLHEIGGLQAGETVVISGAAGAVGVIAGQIAKIRGCRVIGIAGSEEKCAMLTHRLGFDAAINYKTTDVTRALGDLCPNGIDLCFENVGGDILDASLTHMKNFGRVVICGLISSYNANQAVPGPYMFRNVIMRRLTIRGFVILDHGDVLPAVLQDLTAWIGEGRLHMPLHVVERLNSAAAALNLLYTGGNTGKLLVHVA